MTKARRIIARLTAVVFALGIFGFLLQFKIISERQTLVLLTIELFLYLYYECQALWHNGERLFWLNPIVLSSVLTFILPFGISNILYFMPEDFVSQVGLQPVVTIAMAKLMFLVVVGAVAMWSGYEFLVGGRGADKMCANSVFRKMIRVSPEISIQGIYLLLGVSLLGRLVAIKLGVFGYAGDPDSVMAAGAYSMYLTISHSTGKIALVALAMYCFSNPSAFSRYKYHLWVISAYEVAFGFLSGSKSPVVMPFVILGFAYYSQKMRFPKLIIPAIVAGFFVAYAVIEPFRVVRHADSDFSGTSVEDIASTMVNAQSVAGDIETGNVPTWLKILSRVNLTYISSVGIEYSSVHNKLPPDSPNFLLNIFLSPFHAVVPRFLMPSKPLGNLGAWYTYEVMGKDVPSSTGMGPFTYLNFAGGTWAVFFGFFLIGIIYRFFNKALKYSGLGGVFVLICLIPILANVDSSFNSIFIELIRKFPILMLVQYFLFKGGASLKAPQSAA